MTEYKGYIIEDPEPVTSIPATTQDLPKDIKSLFDRLNSTGLGHHRDPLCVDSNYTKNKYRFSVLPEEKRVVATPEQTADAFEKWYVEEWVQRSIIHKIGSILYYLPSHLYRKYLSTIDYRFYYNGFVSFIDRTRIKLFGK